MFLFYFRKKFTHNRPRLGIFLFGGGRGVGKVPRAIDHGTNERSQLSSVIVARDFCRISAIVDIPMPKDVLRYEEGKEKLRIFSRAIQRA